VAGMLAASVAVFVERKSRRATGLLHQNIVIFIVFGNVVE